jgi:hypothetical protein
MTGVFEQELRKGTGVPFLLLEKNLVRANECIDRIIVDKIVHDTRFDPQCEGSRAQYLYELVSRYERKRFIYPQVVKAFEHIHWYDSDAYNYDDDQVIHFVTGMVQAGFYERNAYLGKLSVLIIEFRNDYGPAIDCIVQRFGMEGVAQVAELLGSLLLNGKGQELGRTPFFSSFKKELGKSAEEISAFLRVENNEKINAYLNHANVYEPQSTYERPTLDAIIERFKQGEYYPFHGWIKNASDDEIKKLKELFMKTADDRFKFAALSGLCNVASGIDEAYLWKELDHAEAMDYASLIIEALIPFGNDKLRDLLDVYPDGVKASAFKAFVSRCEEADKKRIEMELLDMTVSQIHYLGSDIIEYERLQKMSFYPAVLRLLYERDECKDCQEKIVRKMVAVGCVDENLAAELRYDASEEIRRLAQA